MSSSNTVLLIARDSALRKSLAFALEVEGFVVHVSDRWDTLDAAAPAWRTVVDEACCRNRQHATPPSGPLILLGSPTGLDLPEDTVALSKPLRMPELLRALRNNP